MLDRAKILHRLLVLGFRQGHGTVPTFTASGRPEVVILSRYADGGPRLYLTTLDRDGYTLYSDTGSTPESILTKLEKKP